MGVSLSRRSFVVGVLATSSSMTLRIRAAAAFEPMTVLAAGAAVVGIIGGVSGLLSDARKEAVLKEINGKLDAVIRGQEVIIAELQALRLYIDDALFRSFRENTIVRMNAHQDRYEVLIVERISSGNRGEFVDLETAVSQTAFELGQYDTPAYVAFGAGVGMTLALHQAIGLSKERFNKLKAVFKRSYDRWLDPSNPKSIVVLLAATTGEINSRKSALAARPRSYSRTYTRGRCDYESVTTVTGDFDNGFRGSVGERTVYCEPREPRPCNPRICALIEEFDETERAVSVKLEAVRLTAPDANAAVEVPSFVPSGIGEVDEMNRERIAIYELMNIAARQQIIKEQMEKCRDSLGRV